MSFERHGIPTGVVCLAAAALFWSFTSIFVKHFFLLGVDGDLQNMYRYLSATLAIWAIAAGMYGRESIAAWRRWHAFLAPAVVNCVFQVVMVSSLYRKSIYPGVMTLLSKSSIVFAVVLTYLLFRDERSTIRSWRYLVGTMLAILGVVGVVMFRGGARGDFNEGVLLILISSFLWAAYTVLMKPVVRHTRPLIGFAMVATFTSLFFVVLTFVRSRPTQFFELSALDQFWVVLSGVLCISAAHSLYFRAVERLGVAISASFLLVQPLLTNALSAIVFKERLNAGQMLMGAVLLGGAYLITRARPPAPGV